MEVDAVAQSPPQETEFVSQSSPGSSSLLQQMPQQRLNQDPKANSQELWAIGITKPSQKQGEKIGMKTNLAPQLLEVSRWPKYQQEHDGGSVAPEDGHLMGQSMNEAINYFANNSTHSLPRDRIIRAIKVLERRMDILKDPRDESLQTIVTTVGIPLKTLKVIVEFMRKPPVEVDPLAQPLQQPTPTSTSSPSPRISPPNLHDMHDGEDPGGTRNAQTKGEWLNLVRLRYEENLQSLPFSTNQPNPDDILQQLYSIRIKEYLVSLL